MEAQIADCGKQITDCGNQTADLGNQIADGGSQTLNVVKQTVDCGHQLKSRDRWTVRLVNRPHPTLNDTLKADKKLTKRATHSKNTLLQVAQSPREPKLAREYSFPPTNQPPIDHSDSTPDDKRHPVTWGLRYCGCSRSSYCITFNLLLSWWTLLCI
jgi:hypothetical protein